MRTGRKQELRNQLVGYYFTALALSYCIKLIQDKPYDLPAVVKKQLDAAVDAIEKARSHLYNHMTPIQAQLGLDPDAT